ncbi:MAG: hypothetical protein ACI4RN_07920 [Oscillospiraceae bacterium]
MDKLSKAIIAAFISLLILSPFQGNTRGKEMLFSGFSLGWSSDISSSKDKSFKIIEDDSDITCSFKIAEIIHKLFD